LVVIERFAYGLASFEELVRARDSAKHAARRVRKRQPRYRHEVAASEAVRDAGRNQTAEVVYFTSRAASRAGLNIRSQIELLRGVYTEWHESETVTRLG
jgi:hypothetical protein